LGGERHSSKFGGQGPRIGAKGQQGRYHPTSKIEGLILRFVGLDYLLFLYSSSGPFSQDENPKLIIINLTELVFPSGFFQGLFT
jgi:hypothetical protein